MNPRKFTTNFWLGVVLLNIQSGCTLPQMTHRRYTDTVGSFITKILEQHLPQCDLIFLQDHYFISNLKTWMQALIYPYYSVTLDGKPFPDYTTWQKITKTTGFSCSTIIVTCKTFDSCRHHDSKILFRMLEANGILLTERRTLMYIELERIQKVPPSLDSIPPARRSYASQNPPVLKNGLLFSAKTVVRELNSHITIIREFVGNHDHTHKSSPDLFYETVTFTPNWFPGGSPIVRSIFAGSAGNSNLKQVIKLNLSMARPKGTITICVSGKHILPAIDVSDEGDLRGLDGELIKIFQEKFGLTLNFIEPQDKDFGSRGTNGEWSGVIGHVIRKEAEIGVGQLTFTEDRFESDLKFSPAIEVLSATAVCPIPNTIPKYKILTYPFDTPTWILVLISSLAGVCSIEIFQAVARKLFGFRISSRNVTACRYPFPPERQRKVPWIQALGPLFLRSVPLQGLVRVWGVLWLFTVWMIFTHIVNVCYTTVLMGTLTVNPREGYVRSPFDLLTQEKRWSLSPLVNQTLQRSLLDREKALVYAADNRTYAWDVISEIKPDERVFRYVNQTGKCGVAESTRSKYYLREISGLTRKRSTHNPFYLSQDSVVLGPTGWAVRSDMDFLVMAYFDQLFVDFRSRGFLDNVLGVWTTTKNHGHLRYTPGSSSSAHIEPLSMSTLWPIFLFCLYGAAISVLVFLVEMIKKWKQ